MIPTPSLLIYALNLPTSHFRHPTVQAGRLAMAKETFTDSTAPSRSIFDRVQQTCFVNVSVSNSQCLVPTATRKAVQPLIPRQ